MYGYFYPCLIYGILETKKDACVHDDILFNYDLDRFTDQVIKNYSYRFIYGIEITIDEMKSGNFHGKEKVDQFHIDFATERPNFYLGIKGDYLMDHSFYDPLTRTD